MHEFSMAVEVINLAEREADRAMSKTIREITYEFNMSQRMATCPKCNAFPSEISGGKKFRVQSVVIE
jgi:Zn finger protein HypA/HybF involved in hydrogenase expression